MTKRAPAAAHDTHPVQELLKKLTPRVHVRLVAHPVEIVLQPLDYCVLQALCARLDPVALHAEAPGAYAAQDGAPVRQNFLLVDVESSAHCKSRARGKLRQCSPRPTTEPNEPTRTGGVVAAETD